jgi:hypothetical protein
MWLAVFRILLLLLRAEKYTRGVMANLGLLDLGTLNAETLLMRLVSLPTSTRVLKILQSFNVELIIVLCLIRKAIFICGEQERLVSLELEAGLMNVPLKLLGKVS